MLLKCVLYSPAEPLHDIILQSWKILYSYHLGHGHGSVRCWVI